jgi:DNA phosphorothioation-associated DGQHR protein 1
MNNNYFQNIPVIEVSQPLGVFYVTKLSAKTLLELTFADPLRVTSEAYSDTEYPLTGAQREQNRKRLKAIADFINTTEAAFPNSIILGANYTKEGDLVEDEEDKPPRRWRIEYKGGNDCSRLIIPAKEKLASIIDGQHRLNAFLWADEKRLSTELVCAIYLDLPNPFQAALFATINFNQKKVDRSLAYLLFGMGLEDEIPEAWSPDKAAVFLSRKLNLDENSPLYQHIIVAAQNDEILFKNKKSSWAVSTATIVDGILKLFSSNPQSDKDKLYKVSIEDGRNRLSLGEDNTPLRNLYKNTNDLAIYAIVRNFFSAAKTQFWDNAPQRSAMTRTVGIQALLDILKLLLKRMRVEKSKDFSDEYFLNELKKTSDVDFSESFFEASGRGKSRIKNVIGLKLGLVQIEKLKGSKDYEEYKEFV